jgi:hypothetical protein
MRERIRTFVHRLGALFHRQRLEDDLDEELRSHLEMAIELNMRKGMSAADARRERFIDGHEFVLSCVTSLS